MQKKRVILEEIGELRDTCKPDLPENVQYTMSTNLDDKENMNTSNLVSQNNKFLDQGFYSYISQKSHNLLNFASSSYTSNITNKARNLYSSNDYKNSPSNNKTLNFTKSDNDFISLDRAAEIKRICRNKTPIGQAGFFSRVSSSKFSSSFNTATISSSYNDSSASPRVRPQKEGIGSYYGKQYEEFGLLANSDIEPDTPSNLTHRYLPIDFKDKEAYKNKLIKYLRKPEFSNCKTQTCKVPQVFSAKRKLSQLYSK